MTHQYGHEPDQSLTSVAGLAFAADSERVLLYDGTAAELRVLSSNLAQLRTIGREGEGPGELAAMPNFLELTARYPQRELVSARDSTVSLYDHRRLQSFTLEGELTEPTRRLPRASLGGQGIRGIHALGDGRVALADIDRSAVPVALNVYVVDGDEARHIVTLDLGSSGRSSYQGPQEARPVWAAQGRCMYVGDGSSASIVRIDLHSSQVDTVALPEVDVKFEERPLIPPMVARVGRSTTPPPEAIWRWTQIAVDPDGHVWAAVYRRSDEDPMVYKITPGGDASRTGLSVIPRTFGPPGVFYTVEKLSETDQQVVRRYSLERGRR